MKRAAHLQQLLVCSVHCLLIIHDCGVIQVVLVDCTMCSAINVCYHFCADTCTMCTTIGISITQVRKFSFTFCHFSTQADSLIIMHRNWCVFNLHYYTNYYIKTPFLSKNPLNDVYFLAQWHYIISLVIIRTSKIVVQLLQTIYVLCSQYVDGTSGY